jgi:hypothetical protein
MGSCVAEVHVVIHTPHVFLAARCSNFDEARARDLPEADQLCFEPGFPALVMLCRFVADRQAPTEWGDLSSRPLLYLDGPPDPVVDEGFQLFQVPELVVRKFAELATAGIEECVTAWEQRLGDVDTALLGHGSPLGVESLTQLAELARRGLSSSKALFVTVLFR